MSEQNPNDDVIVISNDESGKTSVIKSSCEHAADTGSEKFNVASTSDFQNSSSHEIITLSSDSEDTDLSPGPDTAKTSHVSDGSKTMPVALLSDETHAANKNKEDNNVEMMEVKPTVEMIEQNLPIKKATEKQSGIITAEENSRIDEIEEIPGVEIIEENPGGEMIEEKPVVKMVEENPVVEMIEDNPGVEIIKENPGVEMTEEKHGTEMIKENPVYDGIDENLTYVSDTSVISDDVCESKKLKISETPIFDLEDEENLLPSEDAEKIELVGFDLEPYSVPDSERYGNCRLISEFEKISYAGRGSFGVVYKVLDVKNETIVALKKMKISLREKEPLSNNVMRELNLLRGADHPNIVNPRGIAVGRNFDSTYLILDCCDYDLAKVIDDEKSSAMLEEPQIKCIMFQLFEGLKFIHLNGIMHRDLTCSNVLFTFEGILKIGDFGLSREMDTEEPMTPEVGSRWYRAIELLLGSVHYSIAVDLWSAGCIFGEVILKKPLFKAHSDMEVISQIADLLGSPNEKTWPGCSELPVLKIYEIKKQPKNRLGSLFSRQSEACLDLIKQLLTSNPKHRITAKAASSHPYFSEDPPPCSPGDLIAILEITDELETLRHDKSENETHDLDMDIDENTQQ